MLRIALVDGDLAIRAGRRLMIDAQPNLLLVYEEADAQVALEKIPDLLVDVLVIDHRLKGFDGLELARKLVDSFSDKGELCPTIIITGTYATPELVLAAIRTGATDVVTQDAPMSELLTAINNAQQPKSLPGKAGAGRHGATTGCLLRRPKRLENRRGFRTKSPPSVRRLRRCQNSPK